MPGFWRVEIQIWSAKDLSVQGSRTSEVQERVQYEKSPGVEESSNPSFLFMDWQDTGVPESVNARAQESMNSRVHYGRSPGILMSGKASPQENQNPRVLAPGTDKSPRVSFFEITRVQELQIPEF